MGHPNPRFLGVARRRDSIPDRAPTALAREGHKKKKEIGMGWKIVALAAGVSVLFWTLSAPGGERDDDELGDGPPPPPRALPPGGDAHPATTRDAGDGGEVASTARAEAEGGGG